MKDSAFYQSNLMTKTEAIQQKPDLFRLSATRLLHSGRLTPSRSQRLDYFDFIIQNIKAKRQCRRSKSRVLCKGKKFPELRPKSEGLPKKKKKSELVFT